jgi:phosphoribosylformylglycinamidine synthase
MEIWCSEAQERYVIGILQENLPRFEALCERENAPFAVVGHTTSKDELVLNDNHFQNSPIHIPLSVLLGKPPQMHRVAEHVHVDQTPFNTANLNLKEAAYRVLRLPTVASKSFLITIGDRSITGLVARDQMVGPWQVPVADVAVTTAAFDTLVGEAMAMGERTPLALLNAAASGRMAIGEVLTNMAAANIAKIGDIKLSANWMVAANYPGEGARLYDTVQAVGKELCPQLGIAIPVGKDSMSMQARWSQGDKEETVTSPLSLVVTGFSPVNNAAKTLTPQLRTDKGPTELWLLDLGQGQNRLGGSALAYVYGELGKTPPDLDDPGQLKAFFQAIQKMNQEGLLLAYHDRSDGGLWATICEMAFAGRMGVNVDISAVDSNPMRALFSEELGAVVQIRSADRAAFEKVLQIHGLADCAHQLGAHIADMHIQVRSEGELLLSEDLLELLAAWTETSHHIQSMRDNPESARQERESLLDPANTGLQAKLSFDPVNSASPSGPRPRMAILREQGVNGQVEMAAAFDRAGFEAVDVHMNDLRAGRVKLADFRGLVACGGFSYGDVLGAGGGWAKSILFNESLRAQFQAFFHRLDSFSLGVCNGCQMMAQLRDLIPGAEHWPQFLRNTSSQFEARLTQVEVLESPSLFFKGMEGSTMPIPVAHGEGRVFFDRPDGASKSHAAMRFVDSTCRATEHFPENPNGSGGGLTAFASEDGRATIMMPHPERAFRTVQHSWHPDHWGEDGPWMRLFRNARNWVG